MITAIFLGAGASAAEGAPLQKDLFREYFKSFKQGDHSNNNIIKNELAEFFKEIFYIDIDTVDFDKVIFPTFEEVLGILDLAERRKESFRNCGLENIGFDDNKIRKNRVLLIFLMAKIIHDKLQESKGLHLDLICRLKENGTIKNTCFVITNYDILIDNALASLYLDPGLSLDYGIDFTDFENNKDWKKPNKSAIKLFKIHGSLNWLYCSVCNTLTLTPKEKGVIKILYEEITCKSCESRLEPIIVPPTFYKDMSNVFLSTVWHKAEQSLREVDEIIFCGYSFPDADMHIKYLLKRIQTNRSKPLKVIVYNHHPKKSDELTKAEEERYKRFLGGSVEYKKESFEDFINSL
ncbi:MAG: SIR2 family protein [Planctomycetota bacterium]